MRTNNIKQRSSLTIIQKVLQPGELLIWWNRPRWEYAKISWRVEGIYALLSSTILALFWSIFIYIVNKQAWNAFVQLFLGNIPLLFIVLLCIIFMANARSWLKSWRTFRNEVPYKAYTLYAVTNQRALIILAPPGLSPTVIAYLPHEIGPLERNTRRDGSGSLMFSPSRPVTLSRYKGIASFPGRFWGIAHVDHIADLLSTLVSHSQLLTQQATERSNDPSE